MYYRLKGEYTKQSEAIMKRTKNNPIKNSSSSRGFRAHWPRGVNPSVFSWHEFLVGVTRSTGTQYTPGACV